MLCCFIIVNNSEFCKSNTVNLHCKHLLIPRLGWSWAVAVPCRILATRSGFTWEILGSVHWIHSGDSMISEVYSSLNGSVSSEMLRLSIFPWREFRVTVSVLGCHTHPLGLHLLDQPENCAGSLCTAGIQMFHSAAVGRKSQARFYTWQQHPSPAQHQLCTALGFPTWAFQPSSGLHWFFNQFIWSDHCWNMFRVKMPGCKTKTKKKNEWQNCGFTQNKTSYQPSLRGSTNFVVADP